MFRTLLVGLAIAVVATPVSAHPKLLSSMPGEGASVAAPAQITLNFSEKLFEKLSGAKLVQADGLAAKAAVKIAADGKSMQIVPVTSLAAGSYSVEWFGVAGDTHRVTGTVHFAVR